MSWTGRRVRAGQLGDNGAGGHRTGQDIAVVGEERPRVVVDSFAQNLSVTGYQTAASADNDPGWALWRANRMDARQALVRIAGGDLRCGVRSPAARRPRVRLRPRGPKDILTAYVDPLADEWPRFALEIWRTQDGAKLRRKQPVRRSSSTRSTSVRSQSTTRYRVERPT